MNMRRFLGAFIVLLIATRTACAFGPEYDGPTGDPGFPKPDWMLQDFCAHGPDFDFCQGYTIDEERRMMILYQGFLGDMADNDCRTALLDLNALREKAEEWWPDESGPPDSMSFAHNLIVTAQTHAHQRYLELRSEHSEEEFCRVIFDEPELKGLLMRCAKNARSAWRCHYE